MTLWKPPKPGNKAWFDRDYELDSQRERDRKLFSR
jgi:hypothetical protein